MGDGQRQQRRIANLRVRIGRPEDAHERCALYPCANPTTAHKREGLNRLYCRQHIEFFRRHGSYIKRSYGAGELKPYRMMALAWLKQHRDGVAVDQAVEAVLRLYRLGGRPVEAFRLAGRTPTERAKAMWAQLRQLQVDPLEVLAAWLAVDRRVQDDPQPDRHEEFQQVQVAKLVHRMAGGTHKRWEHQQPNGQLEITELHKHPVSRGLVLRHVGKDVADACSCLRPLKWATAVD